MKIKVDFCRCRSNILYPPNFLNKIFLSGEFSFFEVVFFEDVILKAVNPSFLVRTFFFFWEQLVEHYCDQKKTTPKNGGSKIFSSKGDDIFTTEHFGFICRSILPFFPCYTLGSAGLLIRIVSYKYELAKSS